MNDRTIGYDCVTQPIQQRMLIQYNYPNLNHIEFYTGPNTGLCQEYIVAVWHIKPKPVAVVDTIEDFAWGDFVVLPEL
jgi:hypothetical protein